MHISEDRLLEHALEIIEDDNERAKIEGHLETCQSCRSRLKQLQSDIDVISSIRPHQSITSTSPSGARPLTGEDSRWPNVVYSLLRAAALVVIGLAVGYGTSVWLEDEPTRVASQYVTLSPPADSISRYAASDGTEISSGYYRHVLQDNE